MLFIMMPCQQITLRLSPLLLQKEIIQVNFKYFFTKLFVRNSYARDAKINYYIYFFMKKIGMLYAMICITINLHAQEQNNSNTDSLKEVNLNEITLSATRFEQNKNI